MAKRENLCHNASSINERKERPVSLHAWSIINRIVGFTRTLIVMVGSLLAMTAQYIVQASCQLFLDNLSPQWRMLL